MRRVTRTAPNQVVGFGVSTGSTEIAPERVWGQGQDRPGLGAGRGYLTGTAALAASISQEG